MDNNSEIIEPKLVANAFNNYFANVGKTLASEIPSVPNSPMEYLNKSMCNSFYVFPTTRSEIETEISELKTGKAVGPSSIPFGILKMLKTDISKPLEFVFNTSLSSGIVPSDFKIANIIPVYKKGSQSCLCNYRISVFDKLLEKLMYNRLIKFLEKNNVLFENQFGFRAKHSTDHAVLCIIDKIQKAIEGRNYSCGIFLDFSKAFDTVNHQILIKKLEYYGIRGIAKDWFVSYLSERQQVVTVNNATSAKCSVNCGILQGSVFGPLLFLLYINDFHCCSDIFDFHLFADDANLFYNNKTLSTLETNINAELNNVYLYGYVLISSHSI